MRNYLLVPFFILTFVEWRKKDTFIWDNTTMY